jgi:hypothetical protein
MPQLSKDEWQAWRDHPVTLALKAAIQERVQDHLKELSDLGSSPERDLVLKGMIKAFQRVLEASPADDDLITMELFTDEV